MLLGPGKIDMPERLNKQKGSSRIDDNNPGNKSWFQRLMENDLTEKNCDYALWFAILVWKMVRPFARAVGWLIKSVCDIILCKDPGWSYFVLWSLIIVCLAVYGITNGRIVGFGASLTLFLMLIIGSAAAFMIAGLLSLLLKKIMYDWSRMHMHFSRGSKPEGAPFCIVLIIIISILIWSIVDMPVCCSDYHYAIYDKAENFVGCNVFNPGPLSTNCAVNVFKNDFVRAIRPDDRIVVDITDNIGAIQAQIVVSYEFINKDKYLQAFSLCKASANGKDPAEYLSKEFTADCRAAVLNDAPIWIAEMARFKKLCAASNYQAIANELTDPATETAANPKAAVSVMDEPALETKWKKKVQKIIAKDVQAQILKKYPLMSVNAY